MTDFASTIPTRAEMIDANDPRICPACGGWGQRIHTRKEVNGLHRRRQCQGCQHRWTTVEADYDRIQVVFHLERVFAQVWNAVASNSSQLRMIDRGESPPPRVALRRSPMPARAEIQDPDEAPGTEDGVEFPAAADYTDEELDRDSDREQAERDDCDDPAGATDRYDDR